jgi:hypothetical protein
MRPNNMPLLSIVKKYNNRSPLSGVVITAKIPFKTKADGMAFVERTNNHPKLNWEIIDYGWSAFETDVNEILENPTGGMKGKI